MFLYMIKPRKKSFLSRLENRKTVLKSGTGNRGTGNREQGTGNEEWGTGNL